MESAILQVPDKNEGTLSPFAAAMELTRGAKSRAIMHIRAECPHAKHVTGASNIENPQLASETLRVLGLRAHARAKRSLTAVTCNQPIS